MLDWRIDTSQPSTDGTRRRSALSVPRMGFELGGNSFRALEGIAHFVPPGRTKNRVRGECLFCMLFTAVVRTCSRGGCSMGQCSNSSSAQRGLWTRLCCHNCPCAATCPVIRITQFATSYSSGWTGDTFWTAWPRRLEGLGNVGNFSCCRDVTWQKTWISMNIITLQHCRSDFELGTERNDFGRAKSK